MDYTSLEFAKDGAIGVLTINRPKALNALNKEVIAELSDFLEKIKGDYGVRALVVTGSGDKSFVAGADITEFIDIEGEKARELSEEGQRVFRELESLKIPSVAAVNGFALGGGLELALSCDFILMSSTAKVGLPEVTLGLIPGYGGTQRLSRCVGKGIARAMTLSGNMFTAEEAEKWGLAVKVYAPDDLLVQAKKWARDMASRAPVAVALSKRAINEGYDKNVFEAMKLESQLFAETFGTNDKVEGVKAFMEKRKPEFQGQ